MNENLKMRPRAYKKFEKGTEKCRHPLPPPPSSSVRGDSLGVFGFECSAKWKTPSWKTSESDQTITEFDQNTLDKLRGFYLRVFGFGYSAKWKTRSGKPRNYIL